jgi:hypothetical protein
MEQAREKFAAVSSKRERGSFFVPSGLCGDGNSGLRGARQSVQSRKSGHGHAGVPHRGWCSTDFTPFVRQIGDGFLFDTSFLGLPGFYEVPDEFRIFSMTVLQTQPALVGQGTIYMLRPSIFFEDLGAPSLYRSLRRVRFPPPTHTARRSASSPRRRRDRRRRERR